MHYSLKGQRKTSEKCGVLLNNSYSKKNSLSSRWDIARFCPQKIPNKDSLAKADKRLGVWHENNTTNRCSVANKHLPYKHPK